MPQPQPMSQLSTDPIAEAIRAAMAEASSQHEYGRLCGLLTKHCEGENVSWPEPSGASE